MKKMEKRTCQNIENEDLLKIYYDQIKLYPLLTFEEEKKLSKLIQEGDKTALNKLIKANLRLVIKIAMPFSTFGVPLLDLIQEGNLGLIISAGKYDYLKNVRFSTYATWWIRQHIIRYLNSKKRMIRLPQHKEELLRKIQKTYHALYQGLNQKPKVDEIAKELGMPVKDINSILNINSNSNPIPLEYSSGRDDSSSVIEFYEDNTYNPEQNLIKKYHREYTRYFLGRLMERERLVLKYRYQLEDNNRYSLREIGATMNLSVEMIRQIEIRALAKIRRHAAFLKKTGLLEAI